MRGRKQKIPADFQPAQWYSSSDDDNGDDQPRDPLPKRRGQEREEVPSDLNYSSIDLESEPEYFSDQIENEIPASLSDIEIEPEPPYNSDNEHNKHGIDRRQNYGTSDNEPGNTNENEM